MPSATSLEKSLIIKKLIGLSDLQHKLVAQVGHYIAGDEKTVYPIDIFNQILYEVAAQYEVLSYLDWAVKRSME